MKKVVSVKLAEIEICCSLGGADQKFLGAKSPNPFHYIECVCWAEKCVNTLFTGYASMPLPRMDSVAR